MDLSAHGSPTLFNCNVEACVRYLFFLLLFFRIAGDGKPDTGTHKHKVYRLYCRRTDIFLKFIPESEF